MGFLDFLGKAKSAFGTGLMRTGQAIRKIGDVSSPAIRKVGQISGVLGRVAPIAGALLAPATGGLSLGIGSAVGKGLGMVSNVAGKVADVAGKVGNIGDAIGTMGQTWSGRGQGAKPYASPADVMVGRTNRIPMNPVGMMGGLPRR